MTENLANSNISYLESEINLVLLAFWSVLKMLI